ncbi:MAG TPA: indole-3-glycerol-phosphate synthase [Candidatus Deferrimicrobium sp.]|nr:indole-3-glycerol-phosphate synthase [Candidatus Deferrimicrobium sp.]
MPDWLDKLANNALELIAEGYYNITTKSNPCSKSLKEAILTRKGFALISEIKFASPSKGVIRAPGELLSIARDMEAGGVAGISILTEPNYFKGNIEFISKVHNQIETPILMKDINLSRVQIAAASRIGASAILLIKTLFDRGYSQEDIHDLIQYSHSKGLEVLLEVHTKEEFLSALSTDTDMIGINNRDLKTLKVDLQVTKRILMNFQSDNRIIVSESGVNIPEDIRFLRNSGVYAFLVGSSIMQSANILETIKGLVNA